MNVCEFLPKSTFHVFSVEKFFPKKVAIFDQNYCGVKFGYFCQIRWRDFKISSGNTDQIISYFQVKVKPFQGSGNVLGSMAPAVAQDSPASGDLGGVALSESDAQKKVNVDTSKPMTTLQVRLSTGGRLIAKLNESNTISDLRRYIRLVRPETPVNFSLHTTFPNKELTDDMATLKDAGVLGAAVLMRAK